MSNMHNSLKGLMNWNGTSKCDFQSQLTKVPTISEGCFASSETVHYTPPTHQDKHYVIDKILVTEERYVRTMIFYYLDSWKRADTTNKLSPMIMLLNVVYGKYWSLAKMIDALEFDSKQTKLVPLSHVEYTELEEIYSSELYLPNCVLEILPLTLLFCVFKKFSTENTKPYMDSKMNSISTMINFNQVFNSDLLDKSSLITTSNTYQWAVNTRRAIVLFVNKMAYNDDSVTGVIRDIFQMVFSQWDNDFMPHINVIMEEIYTKRLWFLGLYPVKRETDLLMAYIEELNKNSREVYAKFMLDQHINDLVAAANIPILSVIGFRLSSLNPPNLEDNIRRVPMSAHVESIVDKLYKLVLDVDPKLAISENKPSLSERSSSVGNSEIKKMTKKGSAPVDTVANESRNQARVGSSACHKIQ